MNAPASPRKRLIVLSAPSGAGKTTLCARLLKELPRLTLSISSTTRAPRGTEKHGIEYFFLAKDAFEREIREGKFAEWAQVHGNYYGTSKDVIKRTLDAGKAVLLDIDVQGAASLRASYPDEALTIFIAPPSLEVLEKRLRGRGTDAEDNIQKRMKNARAEMAESPKFDLVIVNNDLELAYLELLQAVKRAIGNG